MRHCCGRSLRLRLRRRPGTRRRLGEFARGSGVGGATATATAPVVVVVVVVAWCGLGPASRLDPEQADKCSCLCPFPRFRRIAFRDGCWASHVRCPVPASLASHAGLPHCGSALHLAGRLMDWKGATTRPDGRIGGSNLAGFGGGKRGTTSNSVCACRLAALCLVGLSVLPCFRIFHFR